MSTCKATVILGKNDICKDCTKTDVCKHKANLDKDPIIGMSVEQCEYFKDKSKFIELPCKVGDTVYICTCFGFWYAPHEIDKCEMKVTRITLVNNSVVFEAKKDKNNADTFIQRQIGKTVFLTKEEAEKALAERN